MAWTKRNAEKSEGQAAGLNSVFSPPLIFLIGSRGSGKSTAARLLAHRLGWMWLDADDVVEFESEDDGVSGVPEVGEELETLAVAEDVDGEETAPLEAADGDSTDADDDDVRPEDQY